MASSAVDRLIDSTLSRAECLAERFAATGIRTVYVGGGTPTVLSSDSLDRLLRGIAKIAPAAIEWTVEANPESLCPHKIEIMAFRGVTRISIGIQSLDDAILGFLGRTHRADDARNAIALAVQSGMAVSADLIAGLPLIGKERDIAAVARASSELIAAGVGHLSAYDLSLEEGTPLASRAASLTMLGEDDSARERELLEETLLQSGFRRYEVSNYARRGDECLHNLTYWRMNSYIGSGPGAVSTIVAARVDEPRPGIDGSSLRIEETRDIADYPLGAAHRAVETEIAPADAAFESIMMAYRTVFGLDTDLFKSRFGVDAQRIIGGTLGVWRDRLIDGEPWPPAVTEKADGGDTRRGTNTVDDSVHYHALDGRGLDTLNRFLADCLREMESTFPSVGGSGCGGAIEA